MATSGLGLEEVGRFLTDRHDRTVADLELLHGGFWSAAYGYRIGDRGLVLRVGQIREGFEMDRDAMAYDTSDLPVPEVLEIGDAFGGAYAISVRHHGRFLETVTTREADVVGPTIVRLLAALKSAPPTATPSSWRDWLRSSSADLLLWRTGDAHAGCPTLRWSRRSFRSRGSAPNPLDGTARSIGGM